MTLMAIPSGKAGTVTTLKIMRGLVRRYKTAPSIRTLAQILTRSLPDKKYTLEADTIFKYVRDKIRYVRDVNGVETIQTPIQTIKLGSGDCDDKSLLVATMLESIGHPTRFIAVGFRGAGFSHVFAETKIGNKWIALETTQLVPLGRKPKNITKHLIMRN